MRARPAATRPDVSQEAAAPPRARLPALRRSGSGHAGRHVVPAVAAGGAIGALARHAVGEAWPTAPGTFPWSTFWVNVVGCLAIGMLLAAVTEGSRPPHPLARPFLGTGVVGGFTTFSTYAVEVDRLLASSAPGLALGYLFGTLAAALVGVHVGVTTARAVLRSRGRDRRETA